MDDFRFTPIGTIRSPYREKFAVPRQPGLVTAGKGDLVLHNQYNREETLRGLEGFSHLWLVFVFHLVPRDNWRAMVRPPRLGGNRKLGVFATRSPFRPNPLGLSVVALEGIEQRNNAQWVLKLGGIDLVDGTPVLDIKPYVPYVDALSNASGGFTEEQDFEPVNVVFSSQGQQQLANLGDDYPDLGLLIEQVIGQQPQPGYHNPENNARAYGMSLYDLNIRWRWTDAHCEVISIEKVRAPGSHT